MNNRYYVMRHGESEANRKGLIVCAEKDALDGYGLTAIGAEKVLEVAIKTRLDSNTLIFSSDFLRARETAEIMQKVIATKSSILYKTDLRERNFGTWNLSNDTHYELIWSDDLKNPNITSNGVETVSQVLHRCMSLINELENSHHGNTILLVGHGDVLQILISYFNGIELRFHRSLAPIKNSEIRILSSQIGVQPRSA